MRHALAFAVSSALIGCQVDPLDATDLSCPCAPDYECVRDRCVDPRADGGRRDAGPRDAGPTSDTGARRDVQLPGDPNTACDDLLAGAEFCESFEDSSLLRWTIVEALDAEVWQSTEAAFRGTGSLRASTASPGAYGEVLSPALDGIGAGDLYVRAYVLIPSDEFALAHANLIHVGGHRTLAATETLAGFNIFDEQVGMYVGAGGVTLNDMTVSVPREEWFCIRFQLEVADTGGSARIELEQELAGEIADIDTLPDEPYVHIGAGLAWTDLKQPPATVFIDELAVGTSPLPCE